MRRTILTGLAVFTLAGTCALNPYPVRSADECIDQYSQSTGPFLYKQTTLSPSVERVIQSPVLMNTNSNTGERIIEKQVITERYAAPAVRRSSWRTRRMTGMRRRPIAHTAMTTRRHTMGERPIFISKTFDRVIERPAINTNPCTSSTSTSTTMGESPCTQVIERPVLMETPVEYVQPVYIINEKPKKKRRGLFGMNLFGLGLF